MRPWKTWTRRSIVRATCLLARQHPEGYWNGELEGDSMLEADYIFLHVLLGTGDQGKMRRGADRNPALPQRRWQLVALSRRSRQHQPLGEVLLRLQADGHVRGRAAHGPDAGVDPGAWRRDRLQHLHQDLSLLARPVRVQLRAGYSAGNRPLSRTGSTSIFTRFPRGRAASSCRCRSLTRKSLTRRSPPSTASASSLSAAARMPTSNCAGTTSVAFSWRNFFILCDRLIHWCERIHIRPLRSLALKKAQKWMLERLEMSDGLGAIYPAILNSIIALRCLGYSLDDPQVIRAMDEFEKLGIDEPNGTAHYSGADLPHAAVHVAGVGHGAGRLRAGRSRPRPQGSAPAPAQPTGCWPRKCATRATGR